MRRRRSMLCSDVKASAALRRSVAAVGTIWEASKLGGLNIKEWLQSRNCDPSRNRFDGQMREKKEKADLDSVRGKADDVEEETGKGTPRTAGIGAQAPKEGFTEITSGRARRQPGLVATCRDCTNEA